MKFAALPAAAFAVVAAFALAGCTQQQQQHTSAAPPPTTTQATDGTIWVPVTSTTTTPKPPPPAPKPPIAPASYTTLSYEFPPPPGSGGGGSAVSMPAPQDWTKSVDGPKTDYRDPTGQLLVQLQLAPVAETIGYTDESTYVVDLMRDREQATRAEYADYHLISLGPVTLGSENLVGAQWQFTFVNNGVTRLVTVVGTDFDGFATAYVSGPAQYGALVTAIANQERDIHVAG